MDKRIYNNSLNKKLLIPKLPTNNDHSQYETPQSTTKSNEDNIIDYRNISLTLTGELSSSCIHRDNLTQKQPNVMLVEDAEDDDEQFISNMKKIIDKNYKMQNKENHSLQSKSYSSKKKKCVFSDEDQNLIKRFKKSVNESKDLHTTSQKPELLQQPENVASISNSKCSVITSTPETASVITLSTPNTDFIRNDINQSLLHIISQKNTQLIPRNIEIVETENVETEVKQFLEDDILYMLTPPNS